MTTHRLTLPPSPPYFPGLVLCVFFLFPNLKVTSWKEICVEWGGRRRHRDLFCRPRENVFFTRVKEVGASLGQVYQTKRILCWEIIRHFSKIFVFLLEAKYLSDHPRFNDHRPLISICGIWHKSKKLIDFNELWSHTNVTIMSIESILNCSHFPMWQYS